VDWYLSGDDPSQVSALRHQVRDYLNRHGDGGSNVGDAEVVVQELVTNAIEHATGPVWVRLSWLEEQPDLVVWDLGPGFTLPSGTAASPIPVGTLDSSQGAAAPYPEQAVPSLFDEGGRGLFLVTHLASSLDVAARRGGGTRVEARLAVTRAASRTVDSSNVSLTDALPALEEASPSGGFSRESFLRALVVQLAQAVEHSAGPDVGEDVVSQVGLAVGTQMEAEYRLAKQIVGRLTPDQLAECFVRLKHAIDGRFYVVEISDDRIVLGNERCPFGNAVRKSPALCRMTSSVFGGISARNRDDGASVVLEERIAVGDPGCRVVVYLGEPPSSSRRFAHRYSSPRAG
jgi:anti-sigma regulatory factor (Ser/Thr protein kinase)/predicted ArsR family transcriptional regulator